MHRSIMVCCRRPPLNGENRPTVAVPHSRDPPTHRLDSGHSPRGPRRQQIAKSRPSGLEKWECSARPGTIHVCDRLADLGTQFRDAVVMVLAFVLPTSYESL